MPSPGRGECHEVDWTVEVLHDGIEQNLRDINEYASPEFGQHTLEVSFNDV